MGKGQELTISPLDSEVSYLRHGSNSLWASPFVRAPQRSQLLNISELGGIFLLLGDYEAGQ